MKIQLRRERRKGLRLLCFCGFIVVAQPVFAQTWTQTLAPTNRWTWIASSADGNELAASGNVCYTSTNSGTTWISNNLPNPNQSVVASPANGIHLVAASSNIGEIDVSTNGGHNWTKSTNYGEAAWFSIASSADGKVVALTEGGPTVHISTNSGATWYLLPQSANTGSEGQYAAMSADGNTLVVAINNVCVCSTTNLGKSWVTNNLGLPWRTIAASADGKKVIAGLYAGNIYTSADSGVTWVQQTNSPNALWWSVASSVDGTKLVAVAGAAGGPGLIYTSPDSGVTWVSNNAPNLPWRAVASSADGSKLFAAANDGANPGGGIWTLQTTPAPQLNLALSNSNLAISWIVPSTNFVLQQSPDLISWTNVTNTPKLNLTSLEYQIGLSPSNSSGFYRLATP